jgi:predicted dehydrogenase
MTERDRPRVALLGRGEDVERWTSALEPLACVRPLPEDLAEVDALVITRGATDPFGRAREALLAGVAVLYAAPFLLSPWQAGVLRDTALRAGRPLRFFEPFRYRPGFAFLRRALEGNEPLWRPRYLRSLCLAAPGGLGRIDELATEQLALCDALLDWQPRHVVAAAAQRSDAGDVCAAFLIVHSSDGPVAQCTLSIAEPTEARQLVAVTSEGTIVMDQLDPVASLRIRREREDEVIVGESSRRSKNERLLACAEEPVAAGARRFVAGVASEDCSISNGDRWVRVASLWWAARQSMAFGGRAEVPVPAPVARDTEPPPLRVIKGGGKLARAAAARPALTLVSR